MDWRVAVLGAAVLAAGCAAPVGGRPVLLLAAAAETRPAAEVDVAPAAQAALEVAARMEKLEDEAAYVNSVAARLQNELVESTAVLVRQRDPESAARAAQVIAFDSAMSRFLADASRISNAAARERWVRWGLAPENMQVVARAYDDDPTTRAGAAALLADRKGPEADRLLGVLLEDGDGEVAARTIDALWARKPSGPILDALWEIVVSQQLRNGGVDLRSNMGSVDDIDVGFQPVQSRVITIRGRAIVVQQNPYEQATRQQLAPLATDLLLHYDDGSMRRRLDAFFAELSPPKGDGAALARALSPNYGGETALDLIRLVEAYAPEGAVKSMMAALQSGSVRDGYLNEINGQAYRMSSRIDLAAVALRLLHESPEDYGIAHLANYNRDAVAGTEGDEDKAIRKVLAFWKAHESAATRPG